MPVPAWSYSSIKTFDQCPKKYYHLRVAKDVEDIAGEAADYGTAVHEAAELQRLAGTRHCEMKLAVTSPETGLKPTEFFAKDVWWRGIIDLAVVNDTKAVMVDYKTGKSARYADVKQLDLMAGALFAHFPKLERIKSALLFVVSDEVVRKVHVREQQEQYMSVFNPQLDRLEGALLSGVWNPKSGPLCGWCPVTSCPHHIER
jgi:PD-(D/E)XK nuclease superfamily